MFSRLRQQQATSAGQLTINFSNKKEYGFAVTRHVRCVCACARKLVRLRLVDSFSREQM